MKPRLPTLFMSLGAISTMLISSGALAVDTAAIDKQVAATLERFYTLSDPNKYLAQNAAAVLVFPKITKAGIGVGGEYGDGALQENGKSVGYYSISGGVYQTYAWRLATQSGNFVQHDGSAGQVLEKQRLVDRSGRIGGGGEEGCRWNLRH
jgi:lipid-binding SYLF domain-containing protein